MLNIEVKDIIQTKLLEMKTIIDRNSKLVTAEDTMYCHEDKAREVDLKLITECEMENNEQRVIQLWSIFK